MEQAHRILGTLGVTDGVGVVRITDRFAFDVATVWSALTEPAHLADWYGRVDGGLAPGGEIHIRIDGPNIDSVGRVVVCTPQVRLRVATRETTESAARGGGHPFDQTIDVTLMPDDADHTELVAEIHGLPIDKLAAYGVGWQIHAEALAAHLAGKPAPDPGTRWAELSGPYRRLAGLC